MLFFHGFLIRPVVCMAVLLFFIYRFRPAAPAMACSSGLAPRLCGAAWGNRHRGVNAVLLPYFPLRRLARCWRYLAFWRADPLPWAPVIYCFFLALVFILPLSLSCLGALRNTSPPPAIISSMSMLSGFNGWNAGCRRRGSAPACWPCGPAWRRQPVVSFASCVNGGTGARR